MSNLVSIKYLRFVQIVTAMLVLYFLININNAYSDTINSVTDGNWNTGSTWDLGIVPSPPDDITVNNDLILDANITISSPGKLTININSSLDGDKNINIGAGASLINHGTINCAKLSNSGTVINNGTITTSNNIDNTGTFTNNGTAIAGTNFNNNSGTINGNGGTIASGNNVINNAGGYLSGQNVCNVDGVTNSLINNSGTIDSATVSICGSPLPVDLLYFNVEAEENKIGVYWATTIETNNDYFSVEKTLNGKEFELVATVKGSGNSNQVINYKTVDENPYEGISYYRLKQTDYDGKYTYSDIVAVNYETLPEVETLPGVNVYPNPSNGDFYIDINGKGTEVQVVILDMMGNEYYSEMISLENGNYYLAVDLYNRKLTTGVYFVVASCNDKHYKKKIVIR